MTIIILILAIAVLGVRLISAQITSLTLSYILSNRGISPSDSEMKEAAEQAVSEYFRLRRSENDD